MPKHGVGLGAHSEAWKEIILALHIRTWISGAAAATLLALPTTGLAATPTSAPAAVPLPPITVRMQGMTEAGYTAGAFTTTAVTGELKRLHNDGVNWLAIQVAWYQTNNTSTVIAPSATMTPTDASVTQLINLAHQNGMRVFLNPFINSMTGSGWQALFHPSNVAAWFQSYDNYLEHYAKLAQADHADLFAIGDEFDSMDTVPAYTPYWGKAIAVTREYYHGPVTYGANYTNYQDVTFWNQLDEVGVDAYFPLSQSSDPTLTQLTASWNQEADQIQSWRVSSGLTNKPFLITELGYPSENSAAANPGGWEPNQPVNLTLQQKLYEATFESIWQRPWLSGIMWFWWANPSNPNWQGGPNDNGYTPRNKPVEATLKQYFTEATAPSQASGSGNGESVTSASSSASGGGGSSTASARPVLVGLVPGEQGSAIYTLQADLQLLGFGNVSMTGVFDAATAAAVTQFEKQHGLPTGGATTMTFRNAVLAALKG